MSDAGDRNTSPDRDLRLAELDAVEHQIVDLERRLDTLVDQRHARIRGLLADGVSVDEVIANTGVERVVVEDAARN